MVLPVSLQLHLKKIPQIAMIVAGLLTLATFLIKHRATTLGFFYVIFALVIFLNVQQMVYWAFIICDVQYLGISDCVGCSPYYDGLILGNYIGFIVAPLTVFLLHWKKILSTSFNFTFSIVFTLAVVVIYMIKEVRW